MRTSLLTLTITASFTDRARAVESRGASSEMDRIESFIQVIPMIKRSELVRVAKLILDQLEEET